MEQLGNLFVRETGAGENPVILVSGLGCGPFIYENLIPVLSSEYRVYLPIVAGFDGTGADISPVVEQTLSSLVQLIERNQLRQPIVIGHSIGGIIVLKLASLYPNLIGRIIVLDAAPRQLDGESAAERKRTNIALADQLFDEADFSNPDSGARQWISEMVLDGSNVNAIASAWNRADRGTLKEFFVEGRMLALDLDVKAITVPVCVIAPFESEVQRAEVFQEFTEAYCGASSVEISMIGPARHFVMLDQPEATSKVILGFCRIAKR